MQNLRFVSIRKLEVVEMGRLIRSFNRGVSIRIWLSGIALLLNVGRTLRASGQEIAEYLRLEKWK